MQTDETSSTKPYSEPSKSSSLLYSVRPDLKHAARQQSQSWLQRLFSLRQPVSWAFWVCDQTVHQKLSSVTSFVGSALQRSQRQSRVCSVVTTRLSTQWKTFWWITRITSWTRYWRTSRSESWWDILLVTENISFCLTLGFCQIIKILMIKNFLSKQNFEWLLIYYLILNFNNFWWSDSEQKDFEAYEEAFQIIAHQVSYI